MGHPRRYLPVSSRATKVATHTQPVFTRRCDPCLHGTGLGSSPCPFYLCRSAYCWHSRHSNYHRQLSQPSLNPLEVGPNLLQPADAGKPLQVKITGVRSSLGSARELMTVGTLSAGDVRSLTGGLIDQAVPVRLNSRLADGSYYFVLVIGATVPHESCWFRRRLEIFLPWCRRSRAHAYDALAGRLATIDAPSAALKRRPVT